MSLTALDRGVRPGKLRDEPSLPARPRTARLLVRPRRRHPVRVALRVGRAALVSFLLTLVTALLVLLTIPTLFGCHNFTVMSGSMEPTIHTGDVVIDRQISPLDARVGDIVTFRDPTDHTKLISHRVRSIYVNGNEVSFVTKGDAVDSVQRWSVPANGHIGLVVIHLYRLGYILWWVSRPWGRVLLVVVPVLLLGAFEIKRIWATPARPKEPRRERAP